MSEAKPTAPSPKPENAPQDDLGKLIAEAMKRSEVLVRDAVKMGKSLVSSNAEDLRIRLR